MSSPNATLSYLSNLLVAWNTCGMTLASQLAATLSTLSTTSRVFLVGNGGSYDNARSIARTLTKAKLHALVPGRCPEDYWDVAISQGYAEIFAAALKDEGVAAGDLVIGVSGSGNSPNIVRALEFAQSAGAHIGALGGRDGGIMAKLCGPEMSWIASSECMEMIEDLHVMIVEAAQQLIMGLPEHDVALSTTQQLTHFLADQNQQSIAELAAGVAEATKNGGTIWVLGASLGANHLRADLGRGATNGLPGIGVCAPELMSINAAMATANDEGLPFILAHGLAKQGVKANDLAISCRFGQGKAVVAECEHLIADAQATLVPINDHADSGDGIHLGGNGVFTADTMLMMIGHAISLGIRAHLKEGLVSRNISLDLELPEGLRRPDRATQHVIQRQAREQGLITDDEQIVFCYGSAHAVRKDT